MKVFWSYANRDDPKPHNVTRLREVFENVLSQCIGQGVELFQDKTELKWGDKWRQRLEEEVFSSNAFVCLLSPSYFKSKMCMQEILWAIESNIIIYPILYRKCRNGFKCDFTEKSDPKVEILNDRSRVLESIQYADFTSLRNKPKDSSEVLDFVDGICEAVALQSH